MIVSIPVCKWAEVDAIMSPVLDAEWSLSTPLRSHQLIRIQATVLAGIGYVKSPLTKRCCASYSVSARRHSQLVCLFEVSDSIDLLVAPIDDDGARIRIAADSFKLCSIMNNWRTQSGSLSNMPHSWREKALKGNPSLSIDTVLDFSECVVEVGCLLTLVGELHRDEKGVLQLRPYEDLLQQHGVRETGMPGSSQDSLLVGKPKPGDIAEKSMEKGEEEAITSQFVLVSDDADLIVWGDPSDGFNQ